MIKAIMFDFDGVLVESAEIKTDAFRGLFSKQLDKVDEIVAYHERNMGISRYIKFQYIYENILNIPYYEDVGKELGARFSEIVLDKIKKAPLVNGAKEFLENNHQDYLLFIASGTPQDELDNIVSSKKLAKYFKGIFGSPMTKQKSIEMVKSKYNLKDDEIVFIGDAESDREAAFSTGIHFVLRHNLRNRLEENGYNIKDLSQLEETIMEIER